MFKYSGRYGWERRYVSTIDLENKWVIGNSFDVLECIPSASIPCIITDPPYTFSTYEKDRLHTEFTRICNGVIIVFSPPENQWICPADQHLFWIKPISTKNTSKRYSRFVEMIFVYGNHLWNTNRHWSQYTNVFTDLVDDASIHPWRKPPSLITRLIKNHTKDGDVILDPFAGSGVVHDVSISLGRVPISIELDAKWAKDYDRDFVEYVNE